MDKQAYLIMVHKAPEQVEILLGLLDYEGNDIYIHIDRKSEELFDKDALRGALKKSDCYFIENPVDVKWAGYSQVECELLLLKEATKRKYSFYHLISGSDLPLKTAGELYDFYDTHKGVNFVRLCPNEETQRMVRVRIYENFITKPYVAKRVVRKIRSYLSPWLLKRMKYGYGAQWFDITDELARDVVKHEKWIKNHFWHFHCPDEEFLQTFINEFGWRDTCYKAENFDMIKRCIDFKRGGGGHPYTFRISDYDYLMNSGMNFARKFEMDVDSEIIYKIADTLKKAD
jgi:hypothetical protein